MFAILELPYMASALRIEACKNNFRTRFVTCYGLVNELIEARQEGVLQRLLQRYARYDLLILDELGYIPFSKEGAELLFQVFLKHQFPVGQTAHPCFFYHDLSAETSSQGSNQFLRKRLTQSAPNCRRH